MVFSFWHLVFCKLVSEAICQWGMNSWRFGGNPWIWLSGCMTWFGASRLRNGFRWPTRWGAVPYQFLHIALGSASELDTQIQIAQRVGYIQNVADLRQDILVVKKMINALITSLKK